MEGNLCEEKKAKPINYPLNSEVFLEHTKEINLLTPSSCS